MNAATARFVGVAVSLYDHATFHPLPRTVAGLQAVGDLLATYDYEVQTLCDPLESAARTALRQLLARDCLPAGGALIVLWSGHGEPAAEGVLHLIGRDTASGTVPEVDSSFLAGLATRTGASQILLLLDTCYAGTGVLSATAVARRVWHELPPDAERLWVGVVASALDLQRARDGVFLERLMALLQRGPADPELQLRWSAHSRGVRGDDLIDALVKEWQIPTQQLDTLMSGNAWVMLPNPRYDPQAPERVVEHLLLAARGGDPGDEASYFSGRVAPLARLVAWVQAARPGLFVVTGPAGSGKSALVGRLVSLSNPDERARLLAGGALEHADPGQRSVHAHVHVRGSTVERLVQELDDQLVRAEVLPPRPGGPRNRGELLGALERSQTVPVIVLDGLDEAGSVAWQMVREVLHLVAEHACLMVATRNLAPAQDGRPLLEVLAPQDGIDLGDAASRQEATTAVRLYVARRLAGIGAGVMDGAAVAEAVLRLPQEEGEGLFLLARVVTSQLRAEPVDTRQPGWEALLSQSVEAAFGRDMARILPLQRDGVELPQATQELLTALAWSYGAGLPADLWPVMATALSATGTPYHRADVYWLLNQAGRYIVEAGEGGDAVYRLSYQRLVEYLHPRPAPADFDAAQHQALPVAMALVDAYRQRLAAGQEPETPTYLWRYVWRHCTDAGPAGVDALRSLVTMNSAFLNDLAVSLHNLGIRYREVGQRQEVIAPTEEAVRIRRDLARTNAAFLNDLAASLNNLGICYREVGQRQEAIAPTAEAVRLYRDLARTNAAFLNDLAMSLNNLGICYREVGQRQEAHRAWDTTIERFVNQPAGFAFLASQRALARPTDELQEACTDLHRSLGLHDLPNTSTLEVRHACRALRARYAPDFDAAWRALTGELPAWLLIDPDLHQDVGVWLRTPTWRANCDYLQAHAETLLSDAVQPIFDELEFATPDDPIIQQHRALLSAAQQHGIAVAYRPLLLHEIVNVWMCTETWPASRDFFTAHHADLNSDEALAILADLATDGQHATLLHHAILTLARLSQADRAYAAIGDPTQLQAGLDEARHTAHAAGLGAYATIGITTAADDTAMAQALFHLALAQALADAQAPDHAAVVRARELAPDQVPVWLGHLSALLGTHPDRQHGLIALSQTLLTPSATA